MLNQTGSLELAGVFPAFDVPRLLAYPPDAVVAVGDQFADPPGDCPRLPENAPVVVMMSASTDPADVRAALRAGARGYLSKGASVTNLVRAISAAAAGDIHLDGNLSAALAAEPPADEPEPTVLTPRERDVLMLVAEGLTHKQIGLRLGLFKSTVDTYVHRLRQKVGSPNKAGLTRLAMERHLLPTADVMLSPPRWGHRKSTLPDPRRPGLR